MSGHSKFANIKHKKEKNDAAKGKIFTIIGREIAVAVKEGGADPANNSRLRDVIAKAKANNMPNGTCGVISFGLKGGRNMSVEFMDQLKLVAIVTHVADARTCVLHPASHTHRQMTDEQLVEAGVAPDLIRLSVGIENAQDIIADLKQALEAVS